MSYPNIDPNGTILNADPFNDKVTVYFTPWQPRGKGLDSSNRTQSNSFDKRTSKLVSDRTKTAKIAGKLPRPLPGFSIVRGSQVVGLEPSHSYLGVPR